MVQLLAPGIRISITALCTGRQLQSLICVRCTTFLQRPLLLIMWLITLPFRVILRSSREESADPLLRMGDSTMQQQIFTDLVECERERHAAEVKQLQRYARSVQLRQSIVSQQATEGLAASHYIRPSWPWTDQSLDSPDRDCTTPTRTAQITLQDDHVEDAFRGVIMMRRRVV